MFTAESMFHSCSSPQGDLSSSALLTIRNHVTSVSLTFKPEMTLITLYFVELIATSFIQQKKTCRHKKVLNPHTALIKVCPSD